MGIKAITTVLSVMVLLMILTACGGDDVETVTVSGVDTEQDQAAAKIISQLPSDQGSASIDVVVTVEFDEELDPTSLLDDSVQMVGPEGPVTGTVTYDPILKQLKFQPDEHLIAFSSYQVYCTELADCHGNLIDIPEGWTFTTIFDQLPPELPDF